MQDPQQLSVLGADRESLHSCLKFEKSAMNISVVANTFIALTKERGRSGFCPLILTSVMILIKREIPQFWTQSKHRRWTKKMRSRTRKHFRVDVLRVNLCTRIDNIFGIPFWAAAPKGPITYAFAHMGNFLLFLLLLLLLHLLCPPLRLQSLNLNLRLKSHP